MLKRETIYVKVFSDRFVIRNMESSETAGLRRDPEHASPRMLVGHYTSAEMHLRDGIAKVRRGLQGHFILMHPMEVTQGRVTRIERKALVEARLGRSQGRRPGWHRACGRSGSEGRA